MTGGHAASGVVRTRVLVIGHERRMLEQNRQEDSYVFYTKYLMSNHITVSVTLNLHASTC